LFQDVKKYRKKNFRLVTNGVDISHFTEIPNNIPQQMRRILKKNKQIIGYYGALASWFDYNLIKEVAQERKDWEFVLIGWDYDSSLQKSGLCSLGNVTVIGPIDYKLIPRFGRFFDVCTIPFLINDITKSTSPVKLFEYMALGKPIVTTEMPECKKYKSVIISKNIVDDFITKVEKALELRNKDEYKKLLLKESRENSWDSKSKEIINLVYKEFKVVAVVDDFTYKNLSPSIDLTRITPKNWKIVIKKVQPDIFFCESAWEGISGEWSGKIYKKDQILDPDLQSITDYCKKKNIPTIFWNKEDPMFYKEFLTSAKLFDYIFTTERSLVRNYKKDCNNENVYELMFGYQPKIFMNASDNYELRNDDVIFAGTWYAQFPERCRDMEKVFNAVINSGLNLRIYDRCYGNGNPSNLYPEKYYKYINPSVSYEKTNEIYRKSKYAININTVKKSKSMFSRRVFEIIASGCHVISNDSKALKMLFGNNITFIKGKLKLKNIAEKNRKALEIIEKDHTMEKKLLYITSKIDKLISRYK